MFTLLGCALCLSVVPAGWPAALADHGLYLHQKGVLNHLYRSIVGAAGMTLYTCGTVKKIPGYKNYVSIDGGMPDNPRFALYQAEYDATVANRADAPRDKIQTIAGRCCESGDLIARDLNFQTAQAGDTLCVFATGAYNYSMASNYNRLPRPPILLVKDGKVQTVVRRESYDDLIRNDVL